MLGLAEESTWRSWARAACAALLLGLVGAFSAFGCACPTRRSPPAEQSTPATKVGSKERVRALRELEASIRGAFSPREQPAWLDASGADPYRIAATGSGFVGVLRGAKALVTLDTELRELRRVPLAESPTSLCVASSDAWIASRHGRRLVRLRLGLEGAAAVAFERELPVAGIADLACGEGGVVYVLPADGSDLLTLAADGRELGRYAALPGGVRLLRHGRFLLENSLFERTLRVLELGPRGVPTREIGRIRHDGTLWAMAATDRSPFPGGLVVAVAGAEDKPLVRAHGEFENIDSFVWLYQLGGNGFTQLTELNVSDFGVVLPKALHLSASSDVLTLDVLGASSGRLLHATWGKDWHVAPEVETEPAPPGVSDALFPQRRTVVYASPLFDAWIKLDTSGSHFQRVDPERRPEPDVRLGEALFFTELMAPDNRSLGTHSRFSCETCHFEGAVDGRVHYTGRNDVSVVTKPLFGLANNRPHFSRAMDPDLSSVCHNEFRVAGAGSGQDPWFTLETAGLPWLHELGIDRGQLGPLELRGALLKFLYAFSHLPNARSQGRDRFSVLEAAGAASFRDHCASCHSAQLFSDDTASEAPFDTWPNLIFSRNAPLVWARGDYAKTGVLPYVHERGTRITSLRRLALKPRYFTNGTAPDLANVLDRFRESPAGPLHDAPANAGFAQLPPETRSALLAFLQLL